MKSIIAIAALCLAAQVQAEPVEPSHAVVNGVTVNMHFMSQRMVIETCNSFNAWPTQIPENMKHSGNEAIGCNVMHNDTRVCDVYAPEPTDLNQTDRFATMGHELLHCFVGRYHS